MRTGMGSLLLKANRIRHSTKGQRYLFIWLSLIPIFGFFLVIWIYPIFSSLFLSLRDWSLIYGAGPFVGIDNYIWALTDHLFWVSLVNTIEYVVMYVGLVMIISLAAALFVISLKEPWKAIVMTLFFIPTITSIIVAALTFEVMYVPGYGIVNYVLSLVGIQYFNWTSNELVKPAIIVFMIWKYFGFYMVLYVTGLLAIPHEFIEASEMDGANSWQVLAFIKLPLLKPIITFNVVTASITTFQIFGPIYVTTRIGEIRDAARSLVIHLYYEAFRYFDLGKGSAIAFLLFLLILGLAIVEMRYLREQFQY